MLRFLFTQKRSNDSPRTLRPSKTNQSPPQKKKGKIRIHAVDLGQTNRLTYGADTQQINTAEAESWPEQLGT